MKFTLKKKINTAIFMAFIIIAVIFIFVQMQLQQKRLETAMNGAETILKTLVERDKEPLANEIFETRARAIKIRIGEMLEVKGIRDISVYASSGKLLMSDGDYPATTDLSDNDMNSSRKVQIIKEKWHGESVISYLQEISVIGEKIGFIRIHYSLSDIEREQFRFLASITGLLISILLVMVTIFNFILTKTIIRPITALRDIMLKTGTSGPGRQARATGEDEIGDLARAFNSMSAALVDSYREIETQKDELRHTKSFLDNIIDSMPSTLAGVGPDGKVTQWNTGAHKATGLSPEEALGRPLVKVLPQPPIEMERVREAMRSREVKIDPKRARREKGATLYEDVTIYPLVANGVEGAVIRIDDVTEKVHMEEMMIQSEKMLSVGGLAAGMAHEINNPIAAMMQTANVMASRLGDNVDMPANQRAAEAAGATMEVIRNFMEARGIPRMIETINESCRRVASIVNNMLSFARKSDAAVSSHDMANLLDKTVDLAAIDYDLKKQYDFKKIEIGKEYEEALPPVPCEGAKIQQVLLNILGNGAQAMNDRWAERASRSVEPDPQRFVLRLALERERGMVRIEIEDNGPGMDEATRKRIFEPFFTTKSVGVGTGLGLSVSYFIITEHHGGEIVAESAPGKGANFIIRLPLERKTFNR